MGEFVNENRGGLGFLVLVIAVSRAWALWIGIGPDATVLTGHWQHADLALLDTDLARTLWFQHAQPPLWNAIIGGAVKLVGPEAGALSAVLHAGFVVLTLAGAVMFLAMLRGAGLGRNPAALWAGIVAVSPSVLYYENYVFYPHPTWVLVILFLFSLQRGVRTGSRRASAGALAALVALAWTWALFHPGFVLICGAAVLWACRQVGGRALGLLAIAVVVSALPALKNLSVTGSLAASSWMGMNLSQTAVPLDSETGRYCDLYLAHQEILARGTGPGDDRFPSLTEPLKSSGEANLNHAEIALRGQECLDLSLKAIGAAPFEWLGAGIARMAETHRIVSFDYLFQPDGWDRFEPERLMARVPVLGDALALLFLVLAVWAAFLARRGEAGRFYLVLLLLIGWVTLVSHLANGHDHQRIRYTISPAWWLLLATLVQSALWSLGRVWTMRGPKR